MDELPQDYTPRDQMLQLAEQLCKDTQIGDRLVSNAESHETQF